MNYDVAIVGGGFSGTALAVQLMRRLPCGHSTLLVDRDETPGRGVAYRTSCKFHLLNVRADDMSVSPNEPDHFLQWLRRNFHSSLDSSHFVPRFLFGQYLEEVLRQEPASNPEVLFSSVIDEVVAINSQSGRLFLRMRTGNEVSASFGVLATGNYPPASPPQLAGISRRYYAPYAWSMDTLSQAPSTGTILLLGTGLTAVDQVFALKAQNFSGDIVMLSAHGLLPFAHVTEATRAQPWMFSSPQTVRSLFSALRREANLASGKGIPWHTVIDSIRPEAQSIWRCLPLSEKRRFLRHARVYWEIHRHRMPPESYRMLKELIVQGQVKVVAGRLLNCIESNDCARVTLRERRSGNVASVAANFVINCAGSQTGAGVIEHPLIRSMLDLGLGRIDPLGLGLDVADSGALIDVLGTVSTSLFAIGPVRKGCLWETTAVPEIRTQAVDLAVRISNQISTKKRRQRGHAR